MYECWTVPDSVDPGPRVGTSGFDQSAKRKREPPVRAGGIKQTYVPFFVVFLAAFARAGAFFAGVLPAFADPAVFLLDDALVFPTTATEPGPGTIVDSSPVSQRMRKSRPTAPITTPMRMA